MTKAQSHSFGFQITKQTEHKYHIFMRLLKKKKKKEEEEDNQGDSERIHEL